MTNLTLEDCVCLGGAGYPIAAGASCHLAMSPVQVLVQASRDGSFAIPLVEVCSIEITGPGVVTSGGGFAGGGFGVEGALQGIAIAVVLNALTTRSKIHTFVTVATNVGELHFHYAGMEPAALRMAMASTFSALRRQDPEWQKSRLAVLEFEREHRSLSPEDFERLKSRILQSQAYIPSETVALPSPAQGPLGSCPNCRTTISLHAAECSKCKAQFGSSSAWRVVPV